MSEEVTGAFGSLEEWAEQSFEGTEWSQDPRTGIAAQLQYLHLGVGARDGHGVLVMIDEEHSHADVSMDMPEAVPTRFRQQLSVFANQRIPYTQRDREWDAKLDAPADEWLYASVFADAVYDAVDAAHRALDSAVWAHARGEAWELDVAPPGRDDAKYDAWGTEHPALAHQ